MKKNKPLKNRPNLQLTMYNDSKILRSKVQEAFANILKLLVRNYLYDHVLPNEAAE